MSLVLLVLVCTIGAIHGKSLYTLRALSREEARASAYGYLHMGSGAPPFFWRMEIRFGVCSATLLDFRDLFFAATMSISCSSRRRTCATSNGFFQNRHPHLQVNKQHDTGPSRISQSMQPVLCEDEAGM